MIYEQLYDWQKNIVDAVYPKESYGLYLDMGLGKSPVSMALAEQHKCTRVIIITINSKVSESVDESGSWLSWAERSSVRYNYIQKKLSKKQTITSDPTLLLINYEALWDRKSTGLALNPLIRDFIALSGGQSCTIIVDESHKMKDMQSMQTKSIMKIYQLLKITAKETYLYLLSGTPFSTGYIDLYSQLKILGCPMNKNQFVEAFCVKGRIPGLLEWQQPIVGYKNISALYDLIHKFAITIKSEEVIHLPDKIFVDHKIPQSEAFNFLIQERLPGKIIGNRIKQFCPDEPWDIRYEKDTKINNPFFRNMAYPNLDWIADTAGTFWMRSRQLSIGFQGSAENYLWYDHERLFELRKFLETYPDNYVLFYNYTPELLKIFEICDELGYNTDVYSGDIKSLIFYDKYESQSESERLTNKKNIILANFASGSTGKNWQLYNKCIIFSLPLFKDFEQGIKRIHRIGSKDTVVYHMFYSNNWLDISMKKALEKQEQYNEDMFKSDLKRIQNEILEKEET